MKQTTRLFLAALMLLLLALPSRAADDGTFFDQSLGDLQAELRTALKDGKQGVMLMFETEWCPYCRKMKAQVLSRADVQTYYHKHFALFAVDAVGSVAMTDFVGKSYATEKDFAAAMKLRGTPTFVFVGQDGKEMARYIGSTRDAKEFMELGRYVAEGHWKKMRFDEFYPAGRR